MNRDGYFERHGYGTYRIGDYQMAAKSTQPRLGTITTPPNETTKTTMSHLLPLSRIELSTQQKGPRSSIFLEFLWERSSYRWRVQLYKQTRTF
jgi:hypothetical protein